jgi:hypothetical protein
VAADLLLAPPVAAALVFEAAVVHHHPVARLNLQQPVAAAQRGA